MTSAAEAFILNLSASCTVDQAVLRLIGWGHDTVYLTDVELAGDGDFLKKYKLVYRKDLGLEEFLSELYQRALMKYADAVPDQATEEQVQDALELHAHWIDETQAFIEKARSYKMDIVDELAKGADSALRVDKDATAEHGITHITIKSLDAWSNETYAIKADGEIEADAAAKAPESDLRQLLESLDDVDGTKKSDVSLYVTLALAVQAFAEKAPPRFQLADGSVNVSQVSQHLESLGAKLNPEAKSLSGQSTSSIKSRIDKALARLRTVKSH